MPPTISWVDEVIQLHSEFESPINFWRWAALTSISAVIKDNVYLRQKMFNLYPNIYVMFHADSGLKKGPPVNVAKKLVREVGNTKIISGRSSIQGILKKLGESVSAPGGKVKGGACGFICSSELSSSLVDDPAATDILTDLYDRSYNEGDWDSLLKSEEFALKDATVSMLTATNEAHSSSFFERKDVAGGFLARTFLIYETEENRPNSLIVTSDDPADQIDYKKLACYLKKLATLKGPFLPLGSKVKTEFHRRSIQNHYNQDYEYFTNAGFIYETWYAGFKQEIKGYKDPTGTINRFGASVLKVAMLLSLSREPNLVIDEESMDEAIQICTKLVGNARKITFGRAEGDVSDGSRKKILILELLQRDDHKISHTHLVKKYWMHGTPKEWEEVVASLRDAEMIEIIPAAGGTAEYEMTKKTVQDLTESLAGRLERVKS